MAGKTGQKRRFWSDEEKRSICTQARVPGVSVAQVARRFAMNTNLIHTWLRDPRFAPEAAATDDAEVEDTTFFPIEITGVSSTPATRISPSPSTCPVTAQRVDITLSDGRRILLEGTTALLSVVSLVEGLAR